MYSNSFKKSVAVTLAILSALFFLCGCTSPAPVRKDKMFEFIGTDNTPSDKTPVSVGIYNTYTAECPELYAALEDGFRDELVIINNYMLKKGYSDASYIIESIPRYVMKADLIRQLMPAAFDSIKAKANELYPDAIIDFTEDMSYPNWYYVAATFPYVTDEQSLLYDILRMKITVTEIAGLVTVSVSMSPLPIQEFAEEKAKLHTEDDNAYLDIRFNYAYLSAIYDMTGMQYIVQPSHFIPSEYEDSLVFPLDNFPVFRDTWCQGRSNNSREHMGTDIKNPEGKEIYSCSSGRVLYTGYSKIPGNYVIILDENTGYEYHYYHMVELTHEVKPGDKVTAGDLIGHVGNTGNSDANHLHISIIAPTGEFMNPFTLMTKLGSRIGA